jgi:hypothetical protein
MSFPLYLLLAFLKKSVSSVKEKARVVRAAPMGAGNAKKSNLETARVVFGFFNQESK